MMVVFYLQTDDSIRYYSIHDRQGNLFKPFTFTVTWGKGLSSGRIKVYTFETRHEMEEKIRGIFKARIRQGYKLLYSFSRKRYYRDLFREFTQEFEATEEVSAHTDFA
ncbi:MAG TPA: WGR domain-containing protein [Spirochaetia bacterium]|nr:WGR domain-containing protein [Spirochaetia bacterium]